MEVLSLGAGVQSTTLLLLSIDGHLPPLDHAIFADTGWEPAAVYEHLARLEPVLDAASIQLHRATAGNLRDDTLAVDARFASIPVYLAGDSGSRGMARRQCTNEYKLTPIKRCVRELLGATRHPNGRVDRVARDGRFVTNWVGISTDEIGRVRPSDVSYMRRRDPLIELDLSRTDCLAYLADRWPHPVPRSACIGCPFHSNRVWREMRDERPAEFADAVDFDRQLRDGGGRLATAMNGDAYLHADRVPLDEVDVDRLGRDEPDPNQLALFGPDPGCSPFACPNESRDEPT